MSLLTITSSASPLQWVKSREVNPQVDAAINQFARITKVLGDCIVKNFDKLCKSARDDEGRTVIYIEKKNMAFVVKEVVLAAAKATPKILEDFFCAINAVDEYFNRQLQLVLTPADAEQIEDIEELASNWFLTHVDAGQPTFAYAFKKIGETRIDFENMAPEELPSYLEELGYTFVEEPQNGDIALFMDEETPVHAGIWKGQGMVDSKWGDDHRMAYLHRLANAPSAFGNKVLYCRPPASDAAD
jgi:hypothetical protein